MSAVSLRDKVLPSHPQVFRDTLTDTPMNTDLVHIQLKDNAIPFRVSAARQIPLRFREPADKCVQDLLLRKVIIPCHEPTEWCAPAFFVVKADGKSVRMVTDYTKLNQ